MIDGIARKFLWKSWWRHQMETFSALLAICAGNSPISGEFPAQRPVTGNGWVNNRESGDLRRHRAHYDGIVMWRLENVFHFVQTSIYKQATVPFKLYIQKQKSHHLKTFPSFPTQEVIATDENFLKKWQDICLSVVNGVLLCEVQYTLLLISLVTTHCIPRRRSRRPKLFIPSATRESIKPYQIPLNKYRLGYSVRGKAVNRYKRPNCRHDDSRFSGANS